MRIEDLKNIEFLNLNVEQIEQLDSYMHLTLETNKMFNLTRNDDESSFVIKNILDSLMMIKSIDLNDKYILDLGSGAGLPGIPLAIYFKNAKFVLLEPTNKRANFLTEVKKQLKLDNVEVVCDRAESYIKLKRNSFDFVVSRAVSQLNMLLELSMPFLKKGGELIAYKGLNYQVEINEAKSALKELNSSVKFVDSFVLPSTQETRNNIFVVLNGKVNEKYPREYNKIKKKAL